MSSFFVLNNVVAPALPLRGDDETGHASKFVFWEDLTLTGGPPEPKQGFTGDDCCYIPDDDGDSWTVEAANAPARGAHMVVEIVGAVDMRVVSERLHKAKANHDRVMESAAGGPTHGEPSTEPHVLNDTRELWERLGYKNEQKWINAGSPEE